MSCSLRYNITDSLERKELAKKHGKELILTAPALEVESEGLRMGIELSKEYGTQGSPIGVFGDRVMFNEELLEEIESIQLARDPEHVRNEVAGLETELLASTRNIMRSLGLSENIVSELRDREGNPIEGVAMADILQRSISYLEGNQDELPEEVIHFYVQAMKDLSEPLYLTMRERVHLEPEYLEVQEEYAGLPYDEEDIIDEAIAKVILNRVRSSVKSEKYSDTGNWAKELFDANGNNVSDKIIEILHKEIRTAPERYIGFEKKDFQGNPSGYLVFLTDNIYSLTVDLIKKSES